MAPSAMQILIIVLLVMVLFGTGRIPVIMENLAKGIKSFKKGLKEGDEDASEAVSMNKEKAEEADPKTDTKAE